MLVLYFIYGAIGRVWFGGDDLPKILQNRGVQTAYMLAGLISIYCPYPFNWLGVVLALIVSCWIQFQYFSRGHGVAIDVGDDKDVTPDEVERYNDRWYAKVCDHIFEKWFKRPNRKYGFLYDFFYLMLRYTCPMLLMTIFDWHYALVGLSIPFVYTACNKLQKEEPWVFDVDKWYWRRGWSLAEIMTGGITYASCYELKFGWLNSYLGL